MKTRKPATDKWGWALFGLLMLLYVAAIAVGMALHAGRAHGQEVEPPRGWSLPIEVIEVYDGDTVTVELRMRARVRLLDCWAPELRDEGGPAAKARLAELANGRRGVLFVPLAGDGRLDKHFTFGRLLGNIWLDGDETDLSTQMVDEGQATRTKEAKEAK